MHIVRTNNTNQTPKHKTTTRPTSTSTISVHQAVSLTQKEAGKDDQTHNIHKTLGVEYVFKACFCDCAPDPKKKYYFFRQEVWKPRFETNLYNINKYTYENAGV